MSAQIGRASTILLPSKTQRGKYKHHLHVVMCEPTAQSDVLLVSVSSYHDNCDQTCILQAADHPFINHKSYVYYQRAGQRKIADLIQRIKSGLYKLREPVSDDVFKKIRSGFDRSKFTKRFVFEYLPPSPL